MAAFINNGGGLVNVGIAMTLQDHFSGPAGDVLSSWQSMMRNAGSFNQGMQAAYMDAINQSTGILKTMGNLVDSAVEVQKNTFLTSKIIGDNLDHQEQLMSLAEEINLRNPLTLMDITSGQKFMAMAGLTAEQIEKASEPAAQLAAIFDMDMGNKGGTADLLTNVMATFNKAPDEAAKVADMLAVATTSANMSLQDLTQSMKYSGAAARNVGIDVDELATYIGILGNRGIQGSMAGTNFAQSINQLIKAMSTKTTVFKQIGLSPKDLKDVHGNLLPIHEVFTKIARATKDLPSADKQAVLFKLFGRQGMRAAVPILDDIISGAGKYEEILRNIRNSEGFTDTTTKELMKGPGWIKALTSGLDNMLKSIGKALEKYFKPISQHFIVPVIKLFTKFIKTDFGTWTVGAVSVLTTFRLIKSVIGYIVVGAKGFTTALFTGNASAAGISRGLGGAKINAASLAIYLERCVSALNRMSYLQMVQMGRITPRGYMPVGPGYAYRVDSKGRGYYINQATRQRVDASKAMGFTPLGMGGAWAGGGGYTPNLNTRTGQIRNTMMSPMFNVTRHAMGGGKTAGKIAFGMTRGFGAVAGGLGRVLGFLAGPWGMAISLGMTFIPQIFDWLRGSKDNEPSPEELEAKRGAEHAALVKALQEGKAATIQINLNGQNIGTYGDGSTVNATIPTGGDDLMNYGMDF